MSKIEGHCLCGQVQYKSEAEPVFQAICSCKDCQHFTGSAFAIAIGVPIESVNFTNAQPNEYSHTADSGNIITKLFCSTCGSSIGTKSSRMIVLSAGNFNDTSWITPQVNAWHNSAQKWWAGVDSQIPKHPKQP